jgi:hypothetical protein
MITQQYAAYTESLLKGAGGRVTASSHTGHGATGYIGGRLAPRLLEQGYKVRVMARDPKRLEGRSWYSRVEVVQGMRSHRRR